MIALDGCGIVSGSCYSNLFYIFCREYSRGLKHVFGAKKEEKLYYCMRDVRSISYLSTMHEVKPLH